MKHRATQFEIGFTSEPFALVVEKSIDADKIQAEKREKEEQQRKESLKQNVFLMLE